VKKVALITTGGTIGMVSSHNGLTPTKLGEDLIKNLGIEKLGIDSIEIKNIMNKDSSNISLSDRIEIGKETAKFLIRDDINGVVITHGTDTMIHTAHILDYGLKGLKKPVIITGAALPSDHPNSDGPENLADSLFVAAEADMATVAICIKKHLYKPENLQEISLYDLEKATEIFFPKGRKRLAKIIENKIIFNRTKRDEKGSRKFGPPIVFRGHSSFSKSCIYQYLERTSPVEETYFDPSFDTDGVYVMSEAENSPIIFEDGIKSKRIRGLVIKGWGAGHVPMKGEESWKNLLSLSKKNEVHVVMCTKYGGPVSPVYEVGMEIARFGVIPSGDWTAEVAKNRIGFINGHNDLIEKIAKEFKVNKKRLWEQLYIGGALFRNKKEEREFEKKSGLCIHFDLLSSRFSFEDAVRIAAEYLS